MNWSTSNDIYSSGFFTLGNICECAHHECISSCGKDFQFHTDGNKCPVSAVYRFNKSKCFSWYGIRNDVKTSLLVFSAVDQFTP